MVRFAVLSDPQLYDSGQVLNKKTAIPTILKNNVDFVLFPGDLTTHGWNMNGCNQCWKSCFYKHEGLEEAKELDGFVKTFIEPLEKQNIQTFSVMGNHDTYTGPILEVKDWVIKKHGNTHYNKIFNKPISSYQSSKTISLNIIGLHIYPNKEISDWLKSQLKNLSDNSRILLFFHYPPSGSHSGEPWWNDAEKSYFYNVIKDYKNKILAICIGHLHVSEEFEWNGIKIINGGGSKVAIVDIVENLVDSSNFSLKISFE